MGDLTLRRATLIDVPVLQRWDREPHVIAATTDDPDAEKAFGDHDWRVEIPKQSDVDEYLIAEIDGRPIGAMQIIDPHREPTHYWGDQRLGFVAVGRRMFDEDDCLVHRLGRDAWRARFPEDATPTVDTTDRDGKQP